VWLLNGHQNFSVDFRVFISVYSASLYFQPDTIYIHTDASPEQWEKAKSSDNEATRWMFSIPNVTHHWIKPPKYTLTCLQIKRIEHVSDFVRTQQLYYYGGIYLDTDVVPLRDVRKLRESGFSNIVGIEDPGLVNNGFMIVSPRVRF
jgi:mannosyltransferase OCH1-like enzyme